jgi:hypothetical protein
LLVPRCLVLVLAGVSHVLSKSLMRVLLEMRVAITARSAGMVCIVAFLASSVNAQTTTTEPFQETMVSGTTLLILAGSAPNGLIQSVRLL